MKSSKEAGYLTVDSIAAFDAYIYMLSASPLALRLKGRDWVLGTSSLTMSKSNPCRIRVNTTLLHTLLSILVVL